MLLVGTSGEPLFLQFKEALPSVLQSHGGVRPSSLLRVPKQFGHGFRVVTAQRIMQSASDSFLGYFHYEGRSFYVRQFRDMKGSFDLPSMTPTELLDYTRGCAALLARAHVQSPAAPQVAGYMGQGDRFDDSIATWVMAYAEQVERDFDTFNQAIASGRLPVDHSQ